jgi:hypothetical protein
MNGVKTTDINMGVLGMQEIEVVFEDDEITAIYWDGTDILDTLSKNKLSTIRENIEQSYNINTRWN